MSGKEFLNCIGVGLFVVDGFSTIILVSEYIKQEICQ
jgi:hypothetical protein